VVVTGFCWVGGGGEGAGRWVCHFCGAVGPRGFLGGLFECVLLGFVCFGGLGGFFWCGRFFCACCFVGTALFCLGGTVLRCLFCLVWGGFLELLWCSRGSWVFFVGLVKRLPFRFWFGGLGGGGTGWWGCWGCGGGVYFGGVVGVGVVGFGEFFGGFKKVVSDFFLGVLGGVCCGLCLGGVVFFGGLWKGGVGGGVGLGPRGVVCCFAVWSGWVFWCSPLGGGFFGFC